MGYTKSSDSLQKDGTPICPPRILHFVILNVEISQILVFLPFCNYNVRRRSQRIDSFVATLDSLKRKLDSL